MKHYHMSDAHVNWIYGVQNNILDRIMVSKGVQSSVLVISIISLKKNFLLIYLATSILVML